MTPSVSSYITTAKPICRKLLEQDARRAAERTFSTAGKSKAAKTARMPSTKNSSSREKTRRIFIKHLIGWLRQLPDCFSHSTAVRFHAIRKVKRLIELTRTI